MYARSRSRTPVGSTRTAILSSPDHSQARLWCVARGAEATVWVAMVQTKRNEVTYLIESFLMV